MFYKKMFILLIHLLTMSFAIYTRPDFNDGLMNGFKPDTEMEDYDIMRFVSNFPDIDNVFICRYCFEVATLLGVVSFMVFQLGEEIKNAGLNSFWKNLVCTLTIFHFLHC